MCVQLNIKYTMVPDTFPTLPLSSNALPTEDPPAIPNSICSALYLDTMPVVDRYLLTVKYFLDEGFYVNIDYHTADPDPQIHDFYVSALQLHALLDAHCFYASSSLLSSAEGHLHACTSRLSFPLLSSEESWPT